MNSEAQKQPRPLLPLILLHIAAAGACFTFFTVVPILACLILMAIGNDPGGPMFFPMFVMGDILFAIAITVVIGGAALLSDLLRRRFRVSLWLPPLVVFFLSTSLCWYLTDGVHPGLSLIAGGVVSLAFVVHWAAVSTVWFLPRFLFRLFHVSNTPPKS